MPSPLPDQATMAEALTVLNRATIAVSKGDYSTASAIGHEMASQGEEAAMFYLLTCFAAVASLSARLGDPEEVLSNLARSVLANSEMLSDVMDDIDSLAGDDFKGFDDA